MEKYHILQLITQGHYKEAKEGLEQYKEQFVIDTDIEMYEQILKVLSQPKVSIICIDCSDEYIADFLEKQNYKNLEAVKLKTSQNMMMDVVNYINGTDSKYVCFLEERQIYDEDKIALLVSKLEEIDHVFVAVCERYYLDEENNVIGSSMRERMGEFSERLYNGWDFLNFCMDVKRNFYGNLSTILCKTNMFSDWQIPQWMGEINEWNCSVALLYAILSKDLILMVEERLVGTILSPLDSQKEEEAKKFQNAFDQLIAYRKEERLGFPFSYDLDKLFQKRENTKRKITFFYSDKGEFHNLSPLMKEAEKRGFQVICTEDMKEEAEIGIYCQHVNFKGNAKFSVIMLHDMMQGIKNWPDHWIAEHWDQFDIGILPGRDWGEKWERQGCFYYANTRKGVYELGYPKADYIQSEEFLYKTSRLKKELNLKYERTILYAPTIERNNHQQEFIEELQSLEANLLIKHAHWSEEIEGSLEIKEQIEEMRKLHEGKYENVYFMDTSANIMDALGISNLLISDESSVMAEALLFSVPSISVTEWAGKELPYDYVYKCSIKQLREYGEQIMNGLKTDIDIEKYRKQLFGNEGRCTIELLDLIEYFTQNGQNLHFKEFFLKPAYEPVCLWS